MARSFPTSVIEAMNAQTTGSVFLSLLEVTHSSWDNVYIVNNNQDITSNSQVYTAFPFSVVLPPDSEELQPTMRVNVSNVTRLFIDEMRTIAGGTELAKCTLKIIEASSPDTVLAQWSNFSLSNLNYDAENMSFDLLIENFLSEPFPSLSITPAFFPGNF